MIISVPGIIPRLIRAHDYKSRRRATRKNSTKASLMISVVSLDAIVIYKTTANSVPYLSSSYI